MAAIDVRLAVTSLWIRSWGYEVGIWIRGTVDFSFETGKRNQKI